MDADRIELLNKQLCVAARGSTVDDVRELVAVGADVNYIYPGNGCSVLIHAVNNRHHPQDIVNFLLANGAIVDQPSNQNSTALLTAAMLGSLPLVKTLIKHRADVNYENAFEHTALVLAVNSKSVELVQYLVENGANVDHSSRSNNWTILHQAALFGGPEIPAYLLANKADINCKTSHGRTPLHLAAHATSSPDVVQLLLANGADVHAVADEGRTVLHDAICSNRVETARVLLAHGISTDVKYWNGDTPFMMAAKRGFVEMFRCLLEHQFGPSHSIWLRGQHPFDYLSHESQQQCTLLARLWSMRLSRPVNTFALLPLELLHMLLCFLSSAHFDD